MATGLGWTYEEIGRRTWWDAKEIFRYWRDFPPSHELLKWAHGYEKPLSTEDKIQKGAMGPQDFFEHYKKTGGKIDGVARG